MELDGNPFGVTSRNWVVSIDQTSERRALQDGRIALI